jgi:hypothetical protein
VTGSVSHPVNRSALLATLHEFLPVDDLSSYVSEWSVDERVLPDDDSVAVAAGEPLCGTCPHIDFTVMPRMYFLRTQRCAQR